MKILFVCSMGRFRSRTAAMCLKAAWNEVRYCGTDKYADVKVTEDDLIWADVIVCMETHHRSKLRRKWKGYSHKMQVWGIPDVYGLLDDELVHKLKVKSENLLEGK